MKRTLPQGFIDMIAGYNTPALAGLVETLTDTEPSVAVRLNRAKCAGEDVAILKEVNSEPIPWASRGYFLEERPRFTLDPALHQGRYYVQDASSMFIGRAISRAIEAGGMENRPLLYLDACAAPGGKTTAAIDSLPEGSTVVANEFVPARAAVLVENVVKWGNPRVVVTRSDTRPLAKALAGMVDIAAVDVPCSGEGMMRKEPDAIAQWSMRLICDTAALQREIVENVWNTIRPGGFLIYSTCTFNRVENEENLKWIIDNLEGAAPVEIDTAPFPEIAGGIDTALPCCRFIPGRVRGEGLFMALVGKEGHSEEAKASRPQRTKGTPKVKPEVAACERWIRDTGERMSLRVDGENVSAATPLIELILSRLAKAKVPVLHAGIPLAVIKGRDLIPTQALAMSTIVDQAAFPTLEVDHDTALDYLARIAISLPEKTPRGFVLLTHNSLPLGFVKNLGNRSNNLYPAPWRIIHR